MADQDNQWLQRVRHTAAEPSFWLIRARTLRQAAEDLWIAGNAHIEFCGGKQSPTLP